MTRRDRSLPRSRSRCPGEASLRNQNSRITAQGLRREPTETASPQLHFLSRNRPHTPPLPRARRALGDDIVTMTTTVCARASSPTIATSAGCAPLRSSTAASPCSRRSAGSSRRTAAASSSTTTRPARCVGGARPTSDRARYPRVCSAGNALDARRKTSDAPDNLSSLTMRMRDECRCSLTMIARAHTACHAAEQPDRGAEVDAERRLLPGPSVGCVGVIVTIGRLRGRWPGPDHARTKRTTVEARVSGVERRRRRFRAARL